jgi:hypothetical protein
MSVDLSDYTDSLLREIAPPGATTYAAVSSDVFVGYLSDAFWEIRMDGFMEPYSCDPDGIILPIGNSQVTAGSPSYIPTAYDPATDIKREDIALIITYAGIKIIANTLTVQASRTRAKAGPVEFEQDFSANFLVERLKELNATKLRLLYLKTFAQDVSVVDAYSARSINPFSYAGNLYDWYVGGVYGDGAYNSLGY